ncbi:hypothetical protein C0993_003360 [Termitomyces sp. T159_Od127]|nr:hypothetical protein C0993_003360 [Termitomyces sp. T159_Od127]
MNPMIKFSAIKGGDEDTSGSEERFPVETRYAFLSDILSNRFRQCAMVKGEVRKLTESNFSTLLGEPYEVQIPSYFLRSIVFRALERLWQRADMSTRLSLAQQLALLEEPAPADFDPEDVHVRDADGEDGMSVYPAAREHYLDVGPSLLRKQHDSVSDLKYEGVKMTRKELEDDSDDDASNESEGSGFEEDGRSSVADDDEEREWEEDGEKREERGEQEDEEDEGDDDEAAPIPLKKSISEKRPAQEREHEEDISSELSKKREADRNKGKAVSRQIAFWDTLLDARIRLQKAVTAANRLPPPLALKEQLELPECQEALNKLLREAAALSEELFQLQERLLKTNDSISPPPRKRRKLESDDDTPIDYVQWLEDATCDASAMEQTYHPHLVQTLAKWSAKIQAVAPSVLLPSNRGAFSSKNSQNTKTVLQLIDETLADHAKLVARTQIRRSKGARIGAPEISDDEVSQEDPNVFDDTDFYQQMLRDVIESKGNGSGGDDWMTIQKQKKAKKKVDTKASKGRKLRYETHEKLQNFMVPVPVIGGWHEEQIDELFASLLGRGFEGPGEEAADGEGEQEEMQLNEALKDGFRVFG